MGWSYETWERIDAYRELLRKRLYQEAIEFYEKEKEDRDFALFAESHAALSQGFIDGLFG